MDNCRVNLYVLIKESDCEKVDLANNDCFPLCNLENNDYKIHTNFPNPLETYLNSEKQILICEKIIDKLITIVNKSIIKEDKKVIKEVLKPYLDLKISIFLYLSNCIPNYKFYKLYTSGSWKEFDSKSKLIINIEKESRREKGNIFNICGKSNLYDFNFFHRFLASLQIIFLKKIIKRKNLYILSCNKSYFMPKVFKKLQQLNRNIITYNQSKKLLQISLIIIKQIYSLIFKNKKICIEFFLIPTFNFQKVEISREEKKFNINYMDKEYLLHVLDDIESYINLNKAYKIYNKKLFKDCLRINSNAIFHTNRFPELNAISSILAEVGTNQHLISHGTHTLQKESLRGDITSESLSIGMLTSNIPKIIIYSQSIFSDHYLLKRKLDFRKITPLNQISKTKNKLKDPAVFNILSAGTVKQLGARRYYFESSFEYIYGIIELCKKLRKLDFKVKLTIRIREVKHEINENILRRIENHFSDIVEISKNIYIGDDINNSDCLIALSSTTLEEGINFQIPSMSYGLSKYNHFEFYEDNKYRINPKLKNYNKLKKIEDILGRNFIYLEDKFLFREKNLFDYI